MLNVSNKFVIPLHFYFRHRYFEGAAVFDRSTIRTPFIKGVKPIMSHQESSPEPNVRQVEPSHELEGQETISSCSHAEENVPRNFDSPPVIHQDEIIPGHSKAAPSPDALMKSTPGKKMTSKKNPKSHSNPSQEASRSPDNHSTSLKPTLKSMKHGHTQPSVDTLPEILRGRTLKTSLSGGDKDEFKAPVVQREHQAKKSVSLSSVQDMSSSLKQGVDTSSKKHQEKPMTPESKKAYLSGIAVPLSSPYNVAMAGQKGKASQQNYHAGDGFHHNTRDNRSEISFQPNYQSNEQYHVDETSLDLVKIRESRPRQMIHGHPPNLASMLRKKQTRSLSPDPLFGLLPPVGNAGSNKIGSSPIPIFPTKESAAKNEAMYEGQTTPSNTEDVDIPRDLIDNS
eukprot:TRINITY_DN4843_c0_g1_i3.p1 TRINITY_DN4843_c0_g1~~TRINITY_DN4843_c0_g1_i3.p1  ORF type:complete len:397 (+),score=63.91 TRINITY_DN4843_c0_g1_i3:307-1497(+)